MILSFVLLYDRKKDSSARDIQAQDEDNSHTPMAKALSFEVQCSGSHDRRSQKNSNKLTKCT